MSHYRNITVNGNTVRKHRRDIWKDDIIKSFLPAGPQHIYEASAGQAQLASELYHSGHKVVISNFNPKNPQGLPKDIKEYGANLNEPLPFEDNTFDVIICREVIEHVESTAHTLREFNRCLKDGGTLILTFPNRLQIRSRFYHFMTCFYRGMKSPINLRYPVGRSHINLIGYPEMDYYLRKTGFNVLAESTSEIQASDYIFLPFLPFFRLVTLYYLLCYKKKAEEFEKLSVEDRAYNRYIAKAVTTKPVFLGKDVIICARKEDPFSGFMSQGV